MLPDRAAIDGGRRRLLASLFVVLGAFASFAVGMSFAGPDLTEFLGRTPVQARIGILALALALIGLAWERDRDLRVMGAARERHEVLVASLENRMTSLQAMMNSDDAPATAPSIDDAMKIVLDAAIDLSGADGGSVKFVDATDELGVHSYSMLETQLLDRSSVEFPLMAQGERVGDLLLVLRPDQDRVDEAALQFFGEQAGTALTLASALSRERQSVTYLQAANVVKSRFLNTVSHELRTPLTSIVGYASTLDHHWDRLAEVQKREFVRAVEFQAARLTRLVERILEAARVEMEGITIRPIIHDVRMSVSNALRPFLEGEPGRVDSRLPDGPLEAEIDPFVVDQIVSNILDNALRYTSERVSVTLDGSHRVVRLTFIDRGAGVDPRRVDMVRQGIFNVGDDFDSGTGLGLHIVNTLVKDHGGKLEVRTGPTGTRIVATLVAGYRPAKEGEPPPPPTIP